MSPLTIYGLLARTCHLPPRTCYGVLPVMVGPDYYYTEMSSNTISGRWCICCLYQKILFFNLDHCLHYISCRDIMQFIGILFLASALQLHQTYACQRNIKWSETPPETLETLYWQMSQTFVEWHFPFYTSFLVFWNFCCNRLEHVHVHLQRKPFIFKCILHGSAGLYFCKF